MKGEFGSAELLKKGVEFVKKYRYLLLIAVVGVVLLLLPTGDGEGGRPPVASDQPTESIEFVEQKIRTALEKIDGVGKAEVVLTLKSGYQTVYATDTRQNATETVVVSTGSGVQQPVVTVRNNPVYQGALVVCEGAGSPTVRLEVTRAVSVLTGLSADKITVSKREGVK